MIRATLIALIGTAGIAACGGSGSSSAGASEPAGRVDSVTIIPAAIALAPGQTFRFEAKVLGSGRVTQAITWSVDLDVLPWLTGSIDPDGTYHAPDVSPDAPVHVRARSAADPSKEAIAVVTLPLRGITILPSTPSVFPSETIQFTAVVTGAANPAVSWTAGFGRIDASGLYQAPAEWTSDYVTASSAAGSARVSIEVLRPAPVLDTISGPGTVGERLMLTGGHVKGAVVLFPAGQGPPIRVLAGSTETSVVVDVPLGAVSGPLQVETEGFPDQGPLLSNAIPFQRTPGLLLHAAQTDLAAGDAEQLEVAWLGAPGPAPLTFDTDLGTVAGQVYMAPSTVTATSFAHVRGCITGTTNCSEVTFAVHPVRVEPAPALVDAGGSLDLVARSGGSPVNATFTAGSAAGTVTAAGHYVAPVTIQDAGQEWLLAEYAGARTWVQVGVTGLTPGQWNRVVEHVDHHRIDPVTMAPRGASADAVAVSGGRAYVLRRMLAGTDDIGRPLDPFAYVWIDVYDLADPVRPHWLGAVESAARATMLFAVAGRLYAWSRTEFELDAYDLTGPLPALVGRDPTAASHSPPIIDGDRLLFFVHPRRAESSISVRAYDFAQGTLPPPTTVALSLPPDAMDPTPQAYISCVTATSDRAYARYARYAGIFGTDGGEALATWDLTVDPPVLLGTFGTDWTSPVFTDLSIAGPLLIDTTTHGSIVYDRGLGLPVKVGELPFIPMRTLAQQGSRFLLGTGLGSMYVLDTSEPVRPRFVSTVEPITPTANAAWVGNLVYAAQGLAGLGIYDTSVDGGPVPQARPLTFADSKFEYVFASTVAGRYLYATGARVVFDPLEDTFAVWDLASSPPAPVWARVFPNPNELDTSGIAISVAGQWLVRGTLTALEMWSLADPAHPVKLTSVPIDVSSLAVDWPVAWVGTAEGDLVALDLAGSSGPTELSRLSLGALPYAITSAGAGRLALALVGTDSGDLVIVDSSNPSAPALLAPAGLGVPTYGIAIDGSLGLAATAAGLATIDLSDLAHPVPIAIRSMPSGDPYGGSYRQSVAASVALHAGIVWVGTAIDGAAGGFYGFDVRDPKFPRLVARGAGGTIEAGAEVLGFVFDGARGFAIGNLSTRGLLELDLSQPRNVVTWIEAERALQK